jgi:uncharacterized protein
MLTTQISKRKMSILAFIVVLSLTLIAVGPGLINSTFAADSSDKPTKRTLNVSGQGTVKVAPDIAYITLGVITEDTDAKAAQQENATTMDKLVSEVKASGIKSEDIKTVNYSIYPKYDYNKDTGASKIIGYTVTNSVQVTVRDMKKVGSVIDLAANTGANITNNISFALSDYDKYYNEALKKAVATTKKKADTIAAAVGISIKLPVSITESGAPAPTVYGVANYAMKADMAGASTPVESGTIEVQANVSMTYEY